MTTLREQIEEAVEQRIVDLQHDFTAPELSKIETSLRDFAKLAVELMLKELGVMVELWYDERMAVEQFVNHMRDYGRME